MTTTDQNSAEIDRVKDLNIIFLNEQIEKSAARIVELEAILCDIHHVAVDNASNTNDAHEIELWGEIMNLADERAPQKSAARIVELESERDRYRDAMLKLVGQIAALQKSAARIGDLRVAFEHLLVSHYNLYLSVWPNGNPNDDIVRKDAIAALQESKGVE